VTQAKSEPLTQRLYLDALPPGDALEYAKASFDHKRLISNIFIVPCRSYTYKRKAMPPGRLDRRNQEHMTTPSAPADTPSPSRPPHHSCPARSRRRGRSRSFELCLAPLASLATAASQREVLCAFEDKFLSAFFDHDRVSFFRAYSARFFVCSCVRFSEQFASEIGTETAREPGVCKT
jgi:hypothetical protein